MFVEERHDIILNLLQKQGKLLVKELSERFNVTEDCIRKDLASLEKRELLKRTYGGAVPLRANSHMFSVQNRKSLEIPAKEIIANKAIHLIGEGETIYLDISTCNVEIAKLLLKSEKSFTIVTNMLEIVQLFAAAGDHRLISVGGVYNTTYDGFIGSMSIDIIKRFKFDKAFIGVVGIDVDENSVYTYAVEDGLTKEAVIKVSRQVYLVAQSSKFSMDGNYRFGKLGEFTGIITDNMGVNLPDQLDIQIL